MRTSLFPIIWIKYCLHYFYFLNNLSYSCVDTCVSECFLIILVTAFQKNGLLSREGLWDEFWEIMMTAVFVFSLGIPTGRTIKMLSNTDYHKNPHIIWRCRFPKTCIISNQELSFVKTKAYALFPNIFAKLNIFYYWGKIYFSKK